MYTCLLSCNKTSFYLEGRLEETNTWVGGAPVTTFTNSINMASRSEILRLYRKLHRTCRKVFVDDVEALNVFRRRIKDDFWKNRHMTEKEELTKVIDEATEAERFLRQNVVQLVQTNQDTYRVKIREDTVLNDNVPLTK
ncbi:complex III assembly factor LYRM7-like [Halichondria panicea]|uniref:complex III assembly factor LYRM7-like n=1 Tax=Halichondria panicea TaxID=6063 RepID=UPI00312BBDC4